MSNQLIVSPRFLKPFLSCFFLSVHILLGAQSVERIEPPFWWSDMNVDTLQLMAYGENIAECQVTVESDLVQVLRTHKADNANYLFIDLRIAPVRQEVLCQLRFSWPDNTVETHNYRFLQRRQGSAQRQGFDNSDVLYLLTPDRFANGDPDNDVIEGMLETTVDRAAEYGRHGGDIEGMIQHLDYLQEMGFTALWPMPLLENNQDRSSYHGYSTTDYYLVDPRLGTNEDYVRLGEEAAERGIKMVMDMIVNHCGSGHWWVADPPFQDWFNYQDKPIAYSNHRKGSVTDPYVAEDDQKLMVEGWFVRSMPDLNQNNPYMAKYLIQNSIWWIEYADLAGVRQDTYPYAFKEFLTDWTCAIMNEYPNFNIVGEIWYDLPSVNAYWQRDHVNQDGYESCLPVLMDFPMTLSLHKALKESDSHDAGWGRMYKTLGLDFLYAHPYDMLVFADNHDMSRIYTILDEDYRLFKLAMTYLLTIRGIPQVFYGTEILMSNPGTESHGIIRSDFPGGWEGDSVNAVTGEGLTARQLEAREFFRTLLNWRKKAKVIHSGALMHFAPDIESRTYVFFRYDEQETVMVVLNKNDQATELSPDRYRRFLGQKSHGTDILSGKKIDVKQPIHVPAMEALVIQLD